MIDMEHTNKTGAYGFLESTFHVFCIMFQGTHRNISGWLSQTLIPNQERWHFGGYEMIY